MSERLSWLNVSFVPNVLTTYTDLDSLGPAAGCSHLNLVVFPVCHSYGLFRIISLQFDIQVVGIEGHVDARFFEGSL